MPLWIPLDIDEKLRMILAQKDNQQAEVMIALVIIESELCGHDVKKLEKRLFNLFNKLIYQKYLMIAEIKSTMFIIENIKKQIVEIKKSDQELFQFTKFLIKKYYKLQQSNAESLGEIDLYVRELK